MRHLSEDHVYEVVDHTMVVVLRRPPTTAMLSALEARIQGLARAEPTKLAYMHVVLDVPTTGRVDEGTRREFLAAATRALPRFEGAAMVLMGEGFRAAAMRSAISGALLILRPAVPVRIVSTVIDGARWLSTLSATPRDPDKVLEVTAKLSQTLLKDYVP